MKNLILLFFALFAFFQAFGHEVDLNQSNFLSQGYNIADSFPKKKIIEDYQLRVLSFYDERGNLVKKMPVDGCPDRSPYARLTFPYKARVADDRPYLPVTFSDTLSIPGYFDLTGFSFSDKKSVFKKASINIPDSIIKVATQIYHYTPPHKIARNDEYAATCSVYEVRDKNSKPIWRSDLVTVYYCNAKVVHEFEINQLLSWEKANISSDGRYLLLVQVIYHDEVKDTNNAHYAENWTERGFPLKLIDMNNPNQYVEINVDYREQPLTDAKYLNNSFHLVFGGEVHVVVDPVNRKVFSKWYPGKKREPLILTIEKKMPDITLYKVSDF